MRKVFVSFFSSISALGDNENEIIHNLENKKDNIYYPSNNEKFKLPHFRVRIDPYKGIVNRCSNIAIKLLDYLTEFFIDKNIPVFIGTSTGGITETEENYKDLLDRRSNFSIFKSHYLNCIGDDIKRVYKDKFNVFFTISTACSSSAQALFKAYLYIKHALIDKAIVIGVDTLSLTTMIGFDSLRLVSHTRTVPFSIERDGLSLGEGGGVLVLEADSNKAEWEVLSIKSNSDGYHISSPDPEGRGQYMCIKSTIDEAGVSVDEIDYINAHGTGTPMNDEVELKAIKNVFKKPIPVSSVKTFVGHTLGASAIVDLAIVFLMLKKGVIYNTLFGKTQMDKEYISKDNIKSKINCFIKNSFGFGGNNVCMLFKRC